MRDPDKPIAAWLKAARLRQMDENGDPWTQERLLGLMRERIGWAPHRPNYSKYERGGATPRREVLAKFVQFWALYDEPGPDLNPAAPEPPPSDRDELIAALRDQTAALSDHTAAIAALVSRIDQLLPADRVREMVAWAAEYMPSNPSQGPTPGPAGSGARS